MKQAAMKTSQSRVADARRHAVTDCEEGTMKGALKKSAFAASTVAISFD